MVHTNKIPLWNNEEVIDSWDLYYTLPGGKYFFGTMTVTTKRIFFETTNNDAVNELVKHSNIFTNSVSSVVEISKERIVSVTSEQCLNGKKALVTFDNGETHILDRKMMSIERITEALKSVN